MADVESVKRYLELDDTKFDDDVSDSLTVATALVDDFVGVGQVPAEVLDLSYTIVAADLFSRRKAPNGIVNSQFIGPDGVTQTGMRLARDPLAGVYGLLRRWVMVW